MFTGYKIRFLIHYGGTRLSLYKGYDDTRQLVPETLYNSTAGAAGEEITMPTYMPANDPQLYPDGTVTLYMKHKSGVRAMISNIRLIADVTPRASASQASIATVDVGAPQTAYISNDYASIYHDIQFFYGENDEIHSTEIRVPAGTMTAEWAVPENSIEYLYNQYHDTDIIQGHTVLKTYYTNGILVGTVTNDAFLTIPKTEST